MRTMRLALVLTLLLTAPASAATVSGGNPLVITGESGEVNTVTVQGAANGISVTDSASELTTDADGCTSASPHTVSCEGTYGVIAADLGDGNDQLTVSGTFLTLELAGGADNDSLDITQAVPFARDAAFTLSGNDGDDELRGSAADDSLSGGPGSDSVDGGRGYDEADYSDHAEDIVVDLRHAGGQGADGEADLLQHIESVFGGLGDDVIVGDARANALRGNQGRDKLRGGPGVDSLDGDGEVDDDLSDPPPLGHDDVRGGAGDDNLFVAAGSVARGDRGDDALHGDGSRLYGGAGRDFVTGTGGRASCGADRDVAGLIGGSEFVAADCELVSPFGASELYVGRIKRSGRVRLRCGHDTSYCFGRMRVGRAHVRFSLGAGESRRIRLRGQVPRGRIRVTLSRIADFPPIRWVTLL
jgi:Ca2+-binding RTX toxin-like protein